MNLDQELCRYQEKMSLTRLSDIRFKVFRSGMSYPTQFQFLAIEFQFQFLIGKKNQFQFLRRKL